MKKSTSECFGVLQLLEIASALDISLTRFSRLEGACLEG